VTVQDYLRVLREQWLIIVSAVVVALAAAGAVSLLRPPDYTARLTMYVSAQTADTAATAFEGAQLSQQRVTSYVELVSSTRVSREVIEELGLTATPEEVAQQITASSALDSVLIDVAVTGRSPEQVAAMANTVEDVFTGLVNELERPATRGAIPPVAVRVVEPAAVPAAPSSTGLPVMLALGLLAGLAVGVGGALARNALDTSVKSSSCGGPRTRPTSARSPMTAMSPSARSRCTRSRSRPAPKRSGSCGRTSSSSMWTTRTR
jgi:non-specific protein-tyrosine kinase